MAVSLIPVILVVAVLVVLVGGVVLVSQRHNRRVDEAERPDDTGLRYRVPEGQDPVTVVTALRDAGYEPVTEGEVVLVHPTAVSSEERERVRTVIERSATGLEAPQPHGPGVRFVDE